MSDYLSLLIGVLGISLTLVLAFINRRNRRWAKILGRTAWLWIKQEVAKSNQALFLRGIRGLMWYLILGSVICISEITRINEMRRYRTLLAETERKLMLMEEKYEVLEASYEALKRLNALGWSQRIEEGLENNDESHGDYETGDQVTKERRSIDQE